MGPLAAIAFDFTSGMRESTVLHRFTILMILTPVSVSVSVSVSVCSMILDTQDTVFK